MSAGTFPELVDLYDNTASLQDRTVTTGILKPELASRFGASGFVGRASGRKCDARRWPGYAPYASLAFETPVRAEGDVDARVWIRIDEVTQSLGIIEQCLEALPDGGVSSSAADSEQTAPRAREGIALVEGFRGDILAWVRMREGRRRRPLSPSRSLVVPVAFAGSRHRRQHRRGFPALQQILQLLLLGARPVRMPPCASCSSRA